MLKRTKGSILITLLVITGFAGTVTNTSLTKKERKHVVSYFKETKSDLQKAVKGLSENQLNWKATPESWSVKECAQHITMAETGLWDMYQGAMKQAPNPEKRSEIKFTDESVVQAVTNRSQKFKAPESIQPVNAPWKTIDETMEAFKSKRTEIINYLKSTTEDLRNHVVSGPVGNMDAYQFALFISAHSNRHTQQINEVKANPNFPKE